MKTKQEKLINKFESMSLKYHKLSLLFNELGKSINLELKKNIHNPNSEKEIKEYLKTKNLNYDRLKNAVIDDLSLLDLKGGNKE